MFKLKKYYVYTWKVGERMFNSIGVGNDLHERVERAPDDIVFISRSRISKREYQELHKMLS